MIVITNGSIYYRLCCVKVLMVVLAITYGDAGFNAYYGVAKELGLGRRWVLTRVGGITNYYRSGFQLLPVVESGAKGLLPVVVLATGVTAASGVLPVLSDTAVAVRNVASQLPGLLLLG